MENNLIGIEESETDPFYRVSDQKFVDKARHTLPEVLRIGPTNDPGKCGVYAKSPLPYKTRFGPVDAPLIEFSSLSSSSFLLKSKVKIHESDFYSNHSSFLYYNTCDEKVCNWMCLVRPASTFEEQNLIAHFVKDEVFYTSTRSIQLDEELKVWYAPKYAQYIGKRPLLPLSKQPNLFDVSKTNNSVQHKSSLLPSVACFECDTSMHERSIPPKKRGWNRTNQNIYKSNDQSMNLHNWTQEVSSVSHVAQIENLESSEFEKQTTSQTASHPSQEPPISNQDKIFTCPECGKLFAKKYTLKVHRTVHSNTFDFLCHACGKGFKRKDKLQDHFKRMHFNSKSTPKLLPAPPVRFVPRVHPKDCEKFLYKCLRCSVGFQRRGMLINHFTNKHPDVDINTIPELTLPIYKDEVTFSCLYCNKSYSTNQKRIQHIRKHHPGRNLPVGIRKSKKIGEKRTDMFKKASVPVALCQCPHCPAQYSSKAKLVKHVDSKHVKNTCTDRLTQNKTVDSRKPPSVCFDAHLVSTPPNEGLLDNQTLKPTNQNKAYSTSQNPPVYYNNVENPVQLWNNRDCSVIEAVPEVMSFSKQGVATQGIDHVISMNSNPDFTNQLPTSYFTMRPDIPLIDDSININNIDADNKIQRMLDLDASKKAFQSSQPDFVCHQPSRSSYVADQSGMEYVDEQRSMNYVSPVNISTSSVPEKNISSIPDNQEKTHSVKKHNILQRCSKPLPPTYFRGRKQFLLQFCGDSIINNNYEAQQQYSSNAPKPSRRYNMENSLVESTSPNPTPNPPSIESSYTPATSNSGGLSGVGMSVLSYSEDINTWMFNH